MAAAVKDRNGFWTSRTAETGSTQPAVDKVKAIIKPFLYNEKKIRVGKAIGNGNMSSVFEAKAADGTTVIVKAIAIKDDLRHPKGGFIYYDRVARKEKQALESLYNAGCSVPKLIDTCEVDIEYTKLLDRHHKDKIVVLIMEKLDHFSKNRDSKTDKMLYQKPINKWKAKYGVEVVAAVIGRQLLEQVLHMNALGVLHRDIKSANILVRYDESFFKTKFCFIDFGFAHLKAFDEFSENKEINDFRGTIEEGGGTRKYYCSMDDSSFSIKDEVFACGMVLADFFGFLRRSNLEVEAKVKDSNLSPQMKRALLNLVEFEAEKRDYKLVMSIFDEIIEKSKKEITGEKGKKVCESIESVKKAEKKFTIHDVEKAIMKHKYTTALEMLNTVDINDKRIYCRVKGIVLILNEEDSKGREALRTSAIAGDLYAEYILAISLLSIGTSRALNMLQNLFKNRDCDEYIKALTAFHLFELHRNEDNGFSLSEDEIAEIKRFATMVNPDRCNFKRLLSIALTAA